MKALIPVTLAATLSACVIAYNGPDNLMPASDAVMTMQSFDSVSLHGGGDIVIRHAEEFSFENTGDPDVWKIAIKDEVLTLKCTKPCSGPRDRAALITLPYLENLSIKGGGDITFTGDFPQTDELNISLVGGGDIDAVAIPADDVNISIVGGGDISVSAADKLSVKIIGGGDITYIGSPEVSKSIIGGGTVRQRN